MIFHTHLRAAATDVAKQFAEARVKIEIPCKITINTAKQAKQEEAQLNVAEFLAGAGKKNPKQKQSKNIFQNTRQRRRCKLTSNDECNRQKKQCARTERDDFRGSAV